jgi:hypothetical protein
MYGGGPIIAREALDIYSKDLSQELSNRTKAGSISRKVRNSIQPEPLSKSNNIFAKSPNGNNRKKRNLFLSENVCVEEDDGIPEEHADQPGQSLQ